MIRAYLIACLISGAAFAQAPSRTPPEMISIQMPRADISDFVKLYRSLTQKKVWIDAELRFDHKMSMFIERPIPRAEAISLIRETKSLRFEKSEIRRFTFPVLHHESSNQAMQRTAGRSAS